MNLETEQDDVVAIFKITVTLQQNVIKSVIKKGIK
jgi:hypothetical protein